MEKEMLNINGNVVGEIKFGVIESKEGEVPFANFTIVRKNKDKKRNIFIAIYMKIRQILLEILKAESIFMSLAILKK